MYQYGNPSPDMIPDRCWATILRYGVVIVYLNTIEFRFSQVGLRHYADPSPEIIHQLAEEDSFFLLAKSVNVHTDDDELLGVHPPPARQGFVLALRPLLTRRQRYVRTLHLR